MFKAVKRENELWVVTALIDGLVEEFVGHELRQAIAVYYRRINESKKSKCVRCQVSSVGGRGLGDDRGMAGSMQSCVQKKQRCHHGNAQVREERPNTASELVA